MPAAKSDSESAINQPLKWRQRPPDGRSAGSTSQFIREYLVRHRGAATRGEILQAILSKPALADRLGRSQGLNRLIQNLRHGGFVTVAGEVVTATARTLRRTATD